MSKLWNCIDEKKISVEAKIRIFLFINILVSCLMGFVTWVIVSRLVLSSWDWALCFIGYPGFFLGFIGGFIFLCRK